jgi:hypothetical protein
MLYTLNNILDEAIDLTEAQENSLETTLRNTDNIPNDPQITELLSFIREDEFTFTSYTHG